MNSRLKLNLSKVTAILVAITLTLGALVTAKAHEIEAGQLSIVHPRTRPTLGNVMVSAVYMMIANEGQQSDTLRSVSSDIAERTEIHETLVIDDVARMQPVKGGVIIPADDAAEFVPLGKHIMLVGLKRKLKAGETFPMTLIFEKQGKVEITVMVVKPKGTPKAKPAKGSHKGSH